MTRKLLFVLACAAGVSAIGLAAAPAPNQMAMNSSSDPYYCPPGAKFCPVPGRDNTHYIDTHFGMDAKTGQVTRYTGSVHPDEVTNNLTTREEVILTVPPISVENRHVPYPGGQPQRPAVYQAPVMAAPFAQPQPVAYQQPSYPAPAPMPLPVYQAPYPPAQVVAAPVYQQPQQYLTPAPVSHSVPAMAAAPEPVATRQIPIMNETTARGGRTSEVANQQPVRQIDVKRQTGEDRVPWWKGGLWRNRKSSDDDDDRPARSSSSSRSGTPPPVSPDDMWGDEDEFSGYNADGSFGGNAAPAPAASNFGQQPQYQQNTYQDPYAAPQTAYGQAPAGGYVGDAYTMPNSPGPTSPYNPGYVYPGTDISYESTFQGGYPQQQQPQMIQSAPVYQDPYSAPPAPVWDAPQQQPAFAMPPPPASAAPAPAPRAAAPAASSGPRGSAQFENAVNMVKNNRFSEAKSLLLSETASDPNNPAVWRWLGDSQYNLLELQDAVDSYQNALRLDPNDYYALRGQGFAYLHRGHELWRKMMEELNLNQRDQAAATFAQAHENYKQSLVKLGDCLRRAPNDEEAVYGEAMAAEGASRKLYSNAISYIKLGPENRERAELFAENCLQVINKGIERAGERARQKPGESGPRALLGGLYLRKAMLYHQLGKGEMALVELRNSHGVQKSILDEIDRNNQTAQKGVADCETYWRQWGGTGQL